MFFCRSRAKGSTCAQYCYTENVPSIVTLKRAILPVATRRRQTRRMLMERNSLQSVPLHLTPSP